MEVSPPKADPIVDSTDDLLREILLRLPILSLVRFKLVSKHWFDLITSTELCKLRNPIPNPAIGLFCRCRGFARDGNYGFHYVPFCPNRSTTPPLGMLHFLRDAPDIRILHSCNGLLLCCRSWVRQPYYVYNPTTNYLFTLPRLGGWHESLNRLSLAFDPAKSCYYKIVRVRYVAVISGKWLHQIEVYSSKEGLWKVCSECFKASVNFDNGVYWNGSIHWISEANADSLYFKIDLQMVKKMPRPPIPNGWPDFRNNYYFGESCDHLYFIPVSMSAIRFNVYEMKRDYSQWFAKYSIDLSSVIEANPCIVRIDHFIRTVEYSYRFYVFAFVRGKEEEDTFLVLRIPGKAIRYNIVDMSCEMLQGFMGVALIEGELDPRVYADPLKIHGANGYQFIESLYYM